MEWELPVTIELIGVDQFRIVPSVFPPINFFEELVEPTEMETLLAIESLTNERILEQVGKINLVKTEDRVVGPGSSVVMAAFTHIGKVSRFSQGNFGVYYAGLSRETAIRETVYHREKFLAATAEKACELTMRCYQGKIAKPLQDIRGEKYSSLHDPSNYIVSQRFAEQMKAYDIWGLIYNSVRHKGGNCIAVFRPSAVTLPVQTVHLAYVWNGRKITTVYEKSNPILEFNNHVASNFACET